MHVIYLVSSGKVSDDNQKNPHSLKNGAAEKAKASK
jgi:hypothetical protein